MLDRVSRAREGPKESGVVPLAHPVLGWAVEGVLFTSNVCQAVA